MWTIDLFKYMCVDCIKSLGTIQIGKFYCTESSEKPTLSCTLTKALTPTKYLEPAWSTKSANYYSNHTDIIKYYWSKSKILPLEKVNRMWGWKCTCLGMVQMRSLCKLCKTDSVSWLVQGVSYKMSHFNCVTDHCQFHKSITLAEKYIYMYYTHSN